MASVFFALLGLNVLLQGISGIINNEDGNRGGISFNKKRTTTKRPIWRPEISSKQLLAEEKGLTAIPPNADDDPEFKYLWADDYYDDYNFEYKKNMIEHGTFESKIQNYHEAEFAEALAKLKEQNDATEAVAAENNGQGQDDGDGEHKTNSDLSGSSTPIINDKIGTTIQSSKIESTTPLPTKQQQINKLQRLQ